MAIEIERKFILPDVPTIARLGPGTNPRQGYLAEDEPVEVRVRITDVAAHLTVKAGTGLSRTEVDITISADDAEALWPHTVGRRIDKTRHRVTLDAGAIQHVAEVDICSGTLAGLSVAEVEFTSETDAAAFNPPDWFGPELTGEPEWSNAAPAEDDPTPDEFIKPWSTETGHRRRSCCTFGDPPHRKRHANVVVRRRGWGSRSARRGATSPPG